jgi:Ala-tRNA(Pro) deacylase
MTDVSGQHTGLGTHGWRAIAQYAEGAGVPFEMVEHRPTETAVAEAREGHVPDDRMAKTLVVVGGPAPVIAVLPADHRLDLAKLRAVLGAARDLRLATEREIGELFPRVEVGAVPPFGAALVGATVVDPRLLLHDEILCPGGDHRHAIRLRSKDLVDLADAKIADVCHEPAEGERRVRFA